jgi:hypothetical protein
MEVLACTSCPFHDPQVRWKATPVPEGFCLTIGSDTDRICLVFTMEEMQQLCAQYAESQLADRAWLQPQEDTP